MVGLLFKWYMIGFFNLLSVQQEVHPIYISVVEIEHNKKDKTLEVSCKIFTDDFEKTLRNAYQTKIDLLNPKDRNAMEKLVADYVLKHITIEVNGKKQKLNFLGYEEIEEGIYSYYQADNVADINRIDISDTILYEYKQEQMSIIHVTVNGNRKSTKLVNPDSKATIEF